MKLNALEKRMERGLALLLSQYLGISPESAEELVPHMGNACLKGGGAWAVVARKDPAEYVGGIVARLPCEDCRENNRTFRLCHMPRIGIYSIESIPAEEVPAKFHRDVGDDPIEVLAWEW